MKKDKYYKIDKRKLKQNPVVINYSVYYKDEIVRFYRIDVNMKLDKVIDFLIMNNFAFAYRIHPNKFITTSTYYINVVEVLEYIEHMDELFIIKNYLENKKIKFTCKKGKINIENKNKLYNYCFR